MLVSEIRRLALVFAKKKTFSSQLQIYQMKQNLFGSHCIEENTFSLVVDIVGKSDFSGNWIIFPCFPEYFSETFRISLEYLSGSNFDICLALI